MVDASQAVRCGHFEIGNLGILKSGGAGIVKPSWPWTLFLEQKLNGK